MTIKFKDTKHDVENVVKQYKKKNDIICYILSAYMLIIAIAYIIVYKEIEISIFLSVFTITLLIVQIYKGKRAIKLSKERFERSFGNEVERTIEFKEDKLIYKNNKNENTFPFEYESITIIEISKNYIIIKNKYKEWVYINRNNITNEEYNNILNIFKNKNIKIKGK